MQIGNRAEYLTRVKWERMTVNGEMVQIAQTPGTIAACCSWPNTKGFDFVTVADER
jgi:hypothetical protein